jgi:hypothetical protein
MPRITISYRRDDSGVITGRIYDRLVLRYGREAVFRDIDDVRFGVDFRTHIELELASTDVVIAIVGPNWAGPSASHSRLSNEADPVRVEIETALRRKVPLIPVLVLSAAMPTVTQLPESLKDFAYRNAVELDAGQNFDVGMERLTRAIDGILGLARASAGETAAVVPPRAPPLRHRIAIGGPIAAVLAIAVAAGWYFGLDRHKSPLPTETATVAPKVAPPPTVAPPSTPAAPAASTPAPAPVDPEMVFWQSIAASNNAADFEEYLRKYPNGQFAGLAGNRLAALRSRAPVTNPPMPEPINPEISTALIKGRQALKAYNYMAAKVWYQKAANLGNVEAEYQLVLLWSLYYHEGDGNRNPLPVNDAEAMAWFRKAADQGHADAANRLASGYQFGMGVAKNDAEAVRWYRKAAERGNVDARDALRITYGVNWQ